MPGHACLLCFTLYNRAESVWEGGELLLRPNAISGRQYHTRLVIMDEDWEIGKVNVGHIGRKQAISYVTSHFPTGEH